MKKFKIGLQLYGVRDKMEKDMDATLKAVKEMGYECVEFAGYFDKTPDEIKAMLEKYNKGARCTSGFKCNTPCKFADGINLDREI